MADRPTDDDFLERLKIRDLLERYCYGHDMHDYDLVATCFTPDVRASYLNGAAKASNRDDFMKVMQSPAAFEFAYQAHNTAHAHIVVDGDSATADSLCVIVLAQGEAGHDALIRGARYLDRLRRENGEWRICEREHRSLWEAVAPENALRFPPAARQA